MKYIFTLLFTFGSIHISFAQKNTTDTVKTCFYQLTGTIDKDSITFNLHRDGERFYGNYYYNATEEPFEVYGEIQNDGSLRITTHNRQTGDTTEEFAGMFIDSSFSGTWTHNGKVLPFKVAIAPNTSGLYFDYVTTKVSTPLPADKHYERSALTYEGGAVCPSFPLKNWKMI